jgi:hypothetical protein
MHDEPWYGVRCVFELQDEDPSSGDYWYEERVTLWRAASADDAIRLAEAEGDEHAEVVGTRRTGLVQSFHIAGSQVGSSTEVFSLIRGSRLSAADYLDAFFDTGTELQRKEGADGS